MDHSQGRRHSMEPSAAHILNPRCGGTLRTRRAPCGHAGHLAGTQGNARHLRIRRAHCGHTRQLADTQGNARHLADTQGPCGHAGPRTTRSPQPSRINHHESLVAGPRIKHRESLMAGPSTIKKVWQRDLAKQRGRGAVRELHARPRTTPRGHAGQRTPRSPQPSSVKSGGGSKVESGE